MATAKNKSRKRQMINPMKEQPNYHYFAGFDWATRHHQVVILDEHGQLAADFQIENSAEGWELWRQKTKVFSALAVCIETNQGAIVERLLQTEGCAVYPIHPKAGEAYCARNAPSGVKTDFRDAWAFANALRVDGHAWKRRQSSDPLLTELRLLCRDELALIEERTPWSTNCAKPWKNTIRSLWKPSGIGLFPRAGTSSSASRLRRRWPKQSNPGLLQSGPRARQNPRTRAAFPRPALVGDPLGNVANRLLL
jgi:hypothetical protein